jgi:flagellar hook assembly protein FlgD
MALITRGWVSGFKGILFVSCMMFTLLSGVDGFASTTVSGRIATDTTWGLAGSPYIVTSAVSVYGDTTTLVTLTIEPGVEVRFNSGVSLMIGNGPSRGALVAQGTESLPIVLTRNLASGSWGSIYFQDGVNEATTVLEHLQIEYVGGVFFNTCSPSIRNSTISGATGSYGLSLQSASPLLENVSLSGSLTYGVYLWYSNPTIRGGSLANTSSTGKGIYGSYSSPVISDYNITVVDAVNNYGVYLTSVTSAVSLTNSVVGNGLFLPNTSISPTITGNTFTNLDRTPMRIGANLVGRVLANNTLSGLTSAGKLEVVGEQVNQDATWPDIGGIYEVISGNIAVYNTTTQASTLTLQPGVEIQFGSSSTLQVGYNTNRGCVVAIGALGNEIKFTRSSSNTGRYPAMVFHDGTVDGATIFENVQFYLSSGTTITNCSPVFRNCIHIDSGATSAFSLTNSSAVLDNVKIQVYAAYGIYLSNSSPTITGGYLYNVKANGYGIYGYGSPQISDYFVNILDYPSRYGIYLTATSSSLSVVNSTIGNSIYLNSGGIMPNITDCIFTHSDTSPPRAGANYIDALLANNIFQNMTANGRIEIVGDQINHDVIWSKQAAPYVVTGAVKVYKSATEAATLTIDAGVEIKFSQDVKLEIGYGTNKGIINARGTADEPITMSLYGTTGVWYGVFFNDYSVDAATVFEYVNITKSRGLRFDSASPTVRNVTVFDGETFGLYFANCSPVLENVHVRANYIFPVYLTVASPRFIGGSLVNTMSGGHGIYIANYSAPKISGYAIDIVETAGFYGVYAPLTTSSLSITNSTIDNSLYIGGNNILPTITGNVFNGLDLAPLHVGAGVIGALVANNTLNGLTAAGRVELLGETIHQNTVWPKLPAPYVLLGQVDVYNSAAPTVAPVLTIEPGVEIRVTQYYGLTVGNAAYAGKLVASGTAADPIRFTANHATPAPGFWKGISLGGAASPRSTIEHATIEYAGYGSSYSNAGVMATSTSPILRDLTIRKTKNSGIYFSLASLSPIVESCDISGSTWGVYSASSNPGIFNNKIYGNTTAGVWNATSAAINARGNWWGAASGPRHPDNSTGTGDIASANVNFNPWLSEVPNTNLSLIRPDVNPAELNPDGGSVLFTGDLSHAASWTIVVKEDTGAVVKTMTGSGTVVAQVWSGDTDQGGTVGNGFYTYTIDATDGTDAAAQVFGVIEATSNFLAMISAPVYDQMFLPFASGSYLNIIGSAVALSNFKDYQLAYGVGDSPTQWTQLTTSTQPVTNGTLMSWATWPLFEDVYSLRLTVNDTLGNAAVRDTKIRFLRIKGQSQSETFISPNADGVKDTLRVIVVYSYPVDWTMTLRNAQSVVVKTYTGSGLSVSQLWDGKDESGQTVEDGTYTYTVQATSSESGLQPVAVGGSVVVDNTLPIAEIMSPLQDAAVFNTVSIIGTADDANMFSYKVELEPMGNGLSVVVADALTSMVSGKLAEWVTQGTDSVISHQNGTYLVWLTVNDKAGNSTSIAQPILLDNLQITDISPSTRTIATQFNEISDIDFTINAAADVTLRIVPESQGQTGTPIYETTIQCPGSGMYSIPWSGQNSSGVTVADEAYLYLLEATDGQRTEVYQPTVLPEPGTISCSNEPDYDAYKNDPLTISCNASKGSRVKINMVASPSFTLVDGIPRVQGNFTYDWDGRGPSGSILPKSWFYYTLGYVVATFPENYIVTTGDTPNVTLIESDPWSLHLSYGQIAKIRYGVDQDAKVTVKIIDPSGQASVLVNDELKTAGVHEVDWYLFDASGDDGNTFQLSGGGDCKISVTAGNPVTGAKRTVLGSIIVAR